MSKYIYTLSM